MASLNENGNLECGNLKGSSKEIRPGRTAHNVSSSSLRKKSDLTLVSKVRFALLRQLLTNLQEVVLGTKLSILFPAIPLAIVAHMYNFGRPWVFALSMLGLTPLAERVSFLTEQIAFFTAPTVGGLLNATCGNATELIIAFFALYQRKIEVGKCFLLGSILSNLLLVLGTSLFCGGLANLKREQKYDRDDEDNDDVSEEPVIGFHSALAWLVGMTAMIALLSEFVVGTIEDASESWGFSVGFISIILLPIVGNAAEHAGAIIFAFKNKLDITLGVALGPATQVSMFVEARLAENSVAIDMPAANVASHSADSAFRGRGRSQTGASRGRNRGRGRGRNTYDSRQQFGHYGRSSTGRTICQVCHKPGHTASYCYHRYEPEFQGDNPSPAALLAGSPIGPDNAWYQDSGATHHLTTDMANLSTHSEYHGSDQVQVGNGSSDRPHTSSRDNYGWSLCSSSFGHCFPACIHRRTYICRYLACPSRTPLK